MGSNPILSAILLRTSARSSTPFEILGAALKRIRAENRWRRIGTQVLPAGVGMIGQRLGFEPFRLTFEVQRLFGEPACQVMFVQHPAGNCISSCSKCLFVVACWNA
jgi:hypothetical protein